VVKTVPAGPNRTGLHNQTTTLQMATVALGSSPLERCQNPDCSNIQLLETIEKPNWQPLKCNPEKTLK